MNRNSTLIGCSRDDDFNSFGRAIPTQPSLITYLCCAKGPKISAQAGLRWSVSIYAEVRRRKFLAHAPNYAEVLDENVYFFQSGAHMQSVTSNKMVPKMKCSQ